MSVLKKMSEKRFQFTKIGMVITHMPSSTNMPQASLDIAQVANGFQTNINCNNQILQTKED